MEEGLEICIFNRDPKGQLSHTSGALVFAAIIQGGGPLIARLWWPSRLAFLGSLALHQSESFCEKKAYLFVWQLWPRGRFRFDTQPDSMKGLSGHRG